MFEKHFVKFNNKVINILKVDYFELDDEELKVTLSINSESLKFKFNDEVSYTRFNSYIKLFCNEFDCGIDLIKKQTDEKELLNG